ncbi:hypothetical protein [Flavobacterium rhizosphaerae]|uniref:Yip1 domain-containing protein n=1 Tax=Flavobacterium rhizosphaerae TaxID=3163298 RepID=A0ABW8YV88_9FLAO
MKIIFNPFEKYPEKALLTLGLLFLIAGSFTGAIFQARYDGVLDTHFVPQKLTVQPFIDIIINTVSLFVVLYPAGYYVNRKSRPIDFLSTILIAPAPFYILPLFNINNFMYSITAPLEQSITNGKNMSGDYSATFTLVDPIALIIILVFSLIALGTLVWFVVLLYNGYKTAANIKTTGQKVFFGAAIIFAEIISKFLISVIPY